MRFLISAVIATLMVFTACKTKDQEVLSTSIQTKLLTAANAYETSGKSPRSINDDGTPHLVASSDWTSGFFPGCLWYAYELYGNEQLKKAAIDYTLKVEDQKNNGKTHDMGFKIFCSFGNAYRLTNDTSYRNVLLQSAATLITRFNPTVGCIRSWDHNQDKWDYPVIIDNMMNLELLMWTFKETGDSSYYHIAVSHANTTLKNHFRKDNSCYHVIGYNPENGEVVKRNTHQGYDHSSAWARGQSWALYGYTMMYRETGIKAYLEQAQKVESFIFNHKNLPKDGIPYWDFDAPNIPHEPRDASAAAINCSALYELASFCPDKNEEYINKANHIMESLKNKVYSAKRKAKHTFLLEHSTGSFPHNSEIDVPIVYADYYYLEALVRQQNTERN